MALHTNSIPHYYLNYSGDTLHIDDSITIPLSNISNTIMFNYSLDGRLALIDRDGVVIEKAPYHKYHASTDSIKLIDGAAEAIHYLNEKNIPTIFITNQPGIHKGLFTHKDLQEMNLFIEDLLNKEIPHTFIDGVFYCPHPAPTEGDTVYDKGCTCRKPKDGMLTASMMLYGKDKSHTFMFGDFASDIGAAVTAGINPVFVATKHDEYDAMQIKIREEYPKVFNNSQYSTLVEAVKSLIR